MWTCRLKEARERRNRWNLEGLFLDTETQESTSFSISIRFGWLALEAVSGPVFKLVLEHFAQVLGEPKEPPTCTGASECQDDSVHLTTSWEIGEGATGIASLLEKLLKIPEGKLLESC